MQQPFSTCIVAFLLVIATASIPKAEGNRNFSTGAWQRAGAAGGTWDRSAMLEPLVAEHKIIGLSKQAIHSLLGLPNYRATLKSIPTNETEHERYKYLLSSDGRKANSIWFDEQELANRHSMSDREPPCNPIFSRPLPQVLLPMNLIEARIKSRAKQLLRFSEFESDVGNAGWVEHVGSVAGGQYWVNVHLAWQLQTDPLRIMVISSAIQGKQWPDRQTEQAEIVGQMQASSYAIITLRDFCH